ncbi:MAG: IS1 family transposase [Pirellulaceae bacterium]|jgi:transposase-like protein/IS1 family transposase|nr:IS1 family transposase [Pirellulaceae bacterium]
MIARQCTHNDRKKHGKDRKGNQRWQCRSCRATFVSDEQRPLGDMRIDLDKAAMVLSMLLEGMSIRACERITKMKRDTICDLIVQVGEGCDKFLASRVRDVESKFIELDELWGFVTKKSKNVKPGDDPEAGDSWTWLAIDSDSKMILAHAVGKRDESTGVPFLRRLHKATTGRAQVTSDGLSVYTHNVPLEMGSRVDFAQLIKNYKSSQTETRYSPATITSIEKKPRFGNPLESRISTSFVERLNLTVRMQVRRFTRLTNAHSKSARHHSAMVALFVAWYDFCRPHETLGKATPAMACGLADAKWTIRDLLTEAAKG